MVNKVNDFLGIIDDEKKISPELLIWTQQAIDCYNRKCICKGCIIKQTMESPCIIKNIIPKIYAFQGKPIFSVNKQRMKISEYFGKNKTNQKLY